MRDQDFDQLFATLDRSVPVNAAFADALFATLVAERRGLQGRRVWLGLLAAALAVLAGAIAIASGGLRPDRLAIAPSLTFETSATRASECPPPPAPAGAVDVGCLDVRQTWLFSLDSNAQTEGEADLWFEAETATEFYLTRSYDFPGPTTELRIAPAGGRDACLRAIARPEPGATAWPIQTALDQIMIYPHGIPFSVMTPETAICATSLGRHLYELHLAEVIPLGAGEASVNIARFTWIDWGAIPD